MAEGRAPISSSRIATGDIARHSFAVVRRGFDTDEVRSYLQSVSRSLEVLEEREQELRAQLAEAEERAAHPVVDEATLTASLGQHSAQILRHAHEEAARIVAQAQESAAALARETQVQVDELQTRTEAASAERVVEVELLVANAENEARQEQERIRSEAVAEGEAIIARAKEEGRDLLEQVQEARRRVLSDLAARRRSLGTQIEQLRAARDEMAASVHGVRDKVDGILSHLDRADDEARAAALAVGDQLRLHGGETPHDQDALDEVPAGADDGALGDAAETEASAESSEGPSVDELFARIRAGSDPGEEGAAGESAASAAGSEHITDEVPVPPSAAAESQPPASATPSVEDAGEASADDDASADGAEEDAGEALSGPDAELATRRDELLSPVSSRLSRAVKRALGDDQNRLLDLLRSTPTLGGDDLLGPEDDHLAAYEAASRALLAEAFAAGTAFAGGRAGASGDEAVTHASSGLARTVVTMVRRRISDGSEDASHRVGAAFREWRGERVERLAGDAATQVFSAGVAAAATDGKLRWVVTSTGGCSDCEDNALAGTVGAHETFPTGHAYPPAHAGCRCLLAPAAD
jgi:DivIVA domain-containing protein